MALSYGTLTDSLIGPLSFAAGEHGLQKIVFSSLDTLMPANTDSEILPSLDGYLTVNVVMSEMCEYLNGRRKEFSAKIDWSTLGEFQKKVLEVNYSIPYGQVMTYGEIAEKIGHPGAARAVGAALGANPMPIVIPCHRVIGSDKGLRGYGGGMEIKAFLLSLEGHRVEGNRVIT